MEIGLKKVDIEKKYNEFLCQNLKWGNKNKIILQVTDSNGIPVTSIVNNRIYFLKIRENTYLAAAGDGRGEYYFYEKKFYSPIIYNKENLVFLFFPSNNNYYTTSVINGNLFIHNDKLENSYHLTTKINPYYFIYFKNERYDLISKDCEIISGRCGDNDGCGGTLTCPDNMICENGYCKEKDIQKNNETIFSPQKYFHKSNSESFYFKISIFMLILIIILIIIILIIYFK